MSITDADGGPQSLQLRPTLGYLEPGGENRDYLGLRILEI